MFNDQFEKALLNVMIQNPDTIATVLERGVSRDTFSCDRKVVFDYVCQNKQSDGAFDLLVMTEALKAEVSDDRVMHELVEINGFCGLRGSLSQYVDKLRNLEGVRQAQALADHINRQVQDGDDVEEIAATLAGAKGDLMDKITADDRSKTIDAKQGSQEYAERLKAIREGKLVGYKTGIECLDILTTGMYAGELWMIGAESSGGKSVMGLQFLMNALFQKAGGVVFTLEMQNWEIHARLYSAFKALDYGFCRNPRIEDEEKFAKLQTAMGWIRQVNLRTNDKAGMTIDFIEAEAERLHNEQKFSVLMVDYIQLIQGGEGGNRQERLANISGRLKQLAKRLGITVISPTQLNKDGAPRESMAIEQDADVFLKVKPDDGGVWVHKNRNGRRHVTLPMILNGSIQRFYEDENMNTEN